MSDIRTALEWLVELDDTISMKTTVGWIQDWQTAIAAARATLAQSAPTPEAAPVATDEELWSLCANRPNLPNSATAALRACYDLGRQHGAAQPLAANGSAMAQSASDADDKVLVHCPKTCWIEIRRIADGKVIYNNHQRGSFVLPVGEPPTPPPAPAGGLVEEVAKAIHPSICAIPNLYRLEARAAIREVAAWLDRYGCHGCSLWLREELDR
jgi:hypothetical protein